MAATRQVPQNAPNFSWPTDEKGKPLSLVTMQISELINIGNYSNVTVGPIAVTRFVDDDEAVAGIQKCGEECEEVLQQYRQIIIEATGKSS
jgi:hypothetical protein